MEKVDSLGMVKVFADAIKAPGEYSFRFNFEAYNPVVLDVNVARGESRQANNENTLVKPDFDEKSMKEKYPGVVFDFSRSRLYNDGSFAGNYKFMMEVKRIEINGQRVPFGSTGVLRTGDGFRFFRPISHGDTLSLYAEGYDTLNYFVK